MATMVEVKVPDIGDFKDIPIIEVLVKPGDTVKVEDSLITLESDKATMDVPSPVGGTYFTPIINAPEVAIMGVCRSFWKQVSNDGKTSSWRFTLPLSLSWDHRVIDGASAARFNSHFAGLLADMRRILI